MKETGSVDSLKEANTCNYLTTKLSDSLMPYPFTKICHHPNLLTIAQNFKIFPAPSRQNKTAVSPP